MQLATRVALLAALFVAGVCARQRCSSDSIGRLSGQSVTLNSVYIPAQDTGIDIPNSCPPGARYVGMEIQVCDLRRAPRVTARSLNHARVHLRGPPGHAMAEITEYCEGYVANSQVDDVEDQGPVTYNDQRPVTYNDQRPVTYNDQRPVNSNDQRPVTYNDQRPVTYNLDSNE